jgi:hypothetical protein
MSTFLRSLFTRKPLANPIHLRAFRNARVRHRSSAFMTAFLLSAFIASVNAQALKVDETTGLTASAVASASAAAHRPERKRLVTLRGKEMTEGARFTLMSDTPLGDYRSFADGERVCVMIPGAAFVSARAAEIGRGFADMRIEQRAENVMLSFRLQPGATVAVLQNFNRLDVIFMTNERATSTGQN